VQESDETSSTGFRGKEDVCHVMMKRVKDEAALFPEMIAFEEDVGHSPQLTAMRALGVIPSGRAKGGRIVGVESVVGSELEGGAL
jgi:hypothetical protein